MKVFDNTSETNSHELIVCRRSAVSLDELLARAKVSEGTYASRLVEELFASIRLYSVELLGDHRAYFSREYDSFAEYLRRRYRFSRGLAEAIAAECRSSEFAYFVKYPDYLWVEEPGRSVLLELLEER